MVFDGQPRRLVAGAAYGRWCFKAKLDDGHVLVRAECYFVEIAFGWHFALGFHFKIFYFEGTLAKVLAMPQDDVGGLVLG